MSETEAGSWQAAYEAGYAALDARDHKRAHDLFRGALDASSDAAAKGPLLLGLAEALFSAGEFETALEVSADAADAIRAAYGATHILMLDYWDLAARIQRDGVGDFGSAAASDSHAQTLRNEIIRAWDARADGLLLHIDSGAIFPPSAAGYQRTGTNVYDRAGQSVSVVFVRPDSDLPITVTFYVYRYAGHSPSDLLDALTARFGQDNPDAQPPTEGEHTVTAYGNSVRGRLRIWHYHDRLGDAIEQLLLFHFDGVFVECRAQYRPANRVAALGTLDRLLQEIGWPAPDD
ncbi:MAG: hypothetical protein AB7G15_00435 [Alphaproteobacteria bacterium]